MSYTRRYRIIDNQDYLEFGILTDDGGVATFHHNGDCVVTTYYQNRVTNIDNDSILYDLSYWEWLALGKAYVKDWDYTPTQQELIEDALDWLCPQHPKDEWVLDYKILKEINI